MTRRSILQWALAAGISALRPVYGQIGSPVQRAAVLGNNFSPLRLPGLVRWLDVSDQSTLFQDSARTTAVSADADPVGGVTDKSLQGHHFTTPTAGARPTYKLSIQNGKPSLRFDGVDDYLSSVAATYTTRTSFIVGNRLGSFVNTNPLFSYNSGLGRLFDNNTQWGYFATEAVAIANVGGIPTSPTIFCLQFASASSCTIRLNGADAGTFDPNDAYASTTAVFLASVSTATLFLNCDIFEFIDCSGLLTAADIRATERYLAAKFGVPI